MLPIIPQVSMPKRMLDDLHRFISYNYSKQLPHSLLVAQSFMLKFPKYGKEVSSSNCMVNFSAMKLTKKFITPL